MHHIVSVIPHFTPQSKEGHRSDALECHGGKDGDHNMAGASPSPHLVLSWPAGAMRCERTSPFSLLPDAACWTVVGYWLRHMGKPSVCAVDAHLGTWLPVVAAVGHGHRVGVIVAVGSQARAEVMIGSVAVACPNQIPESAWEAAAACRVWKPMSVGC